MKNKIPLIIIIVVVIILIIVATIFFGKEEKEKGESPLKDEEIAQEIYGFSAEIKEIQGQTLLIEGRIPLAQGQENKTTNASVRAVVTDETKIVRVKFPEEKVSESNEAVQPEEIEVSFDDLTVGEKIHIITQDNIYQKLKDNDTFEVKKVFVLE